MSEPRQAAKPVNAGKTTAPGPWYARMRPLLDAVKLAEGPASFISQAGAKSRMTIHQFDGGRDAQYLFVRQQVADCGLALLFMPDSSPPREMIGFLPQVAGTDIIYDLNDETMQGKCRPFVCDLNPDRVRLYALLPWQLESIVITPKAASTERTAHVEFHDARGERLQALLPFHLRMEAGGEVIHADYYVTEADGLFRFPPELEAALPSRCQVIVRSQLTGSHTTLSFS